VYPRDLPSREWLAAYTARFDTVELNNSFYRLPEPAQFSDWRDQVPRGFVFAVKASRYLTHFKRLIDPEEPLDRLLRAAAPLKRALGPVLYQLPPRWVPPQDRLEHFLASLPRTIGRPARRLEHVIEFRDPRCYDDRILAALDRHGVSLCLHDMPGSETPRVRIGPCLYLRLHGFGAKYGGSYPDDVLEGWAAWVTDAASARNGYVYFNNDRDANAVRDADRLRALLKASASDVRPAAAAPRQSRERFRPSPADSRGRRQ
jgi:uncharacterized protein YecE (DUF72 family)